MNDIKRFIGNGNNNEYLHFYHKAINENKIIPRGRGRRPIGLMKVDISRSKDYSLIFNQLNDAFEGNLLALVVNKSNRKMRLILKE